MTDATDRAIDPQSAIGVFDSGVGGLTVVAELHRRLPRESILYLGDTARLPYGTKSRTTVERYTRRNIDFLVERGVKAIVVACNTASALALKELEVPVPLLGVIEPGARRAATVSRGRVGVIATESTVRSDAYRRALLAERRDLRVWTHAAPLLVPLVEEGWHDDPITAEVVRRYLAPLLEHDVDTLVLGCTHYPLLAEVVSRVAGSGVALVDSAEAVTREMSALLQSAELLSPERTTAKTRLCLTDGSERFPPDRGADSRPPGHPRRTRRRHIARHGRPRSPARLECRP